MTQSASDNPYINVYLWFEVSEEHDVVDAFLGAQRVGHVTGQERTAPVGSVDAASRFRERLRLLGILQWFGPPMGVSLTASKPAPLPPLPPI